MDRELSGGEVLDFGGGAEILAIPGHTEGSIAVHLPAHGVVFAGDAIANVGTVMLGPFNQDRARSVASFRRLAALDVETACFGHGAPIASETGSATPPSGSATPDGQVRPRHPRRGTPAMRPSPPVSSTCRFVSRNRPW
jgi:glyoxylase-like metal-dependent hydrolase (beta-lactamase superfamily II)